MHDMSEAKVVTLTVLGLIILGRFLRGLMLRKIKRTLRDITLGEGN